MKLVRVAMFEKESDIAEIESSVLANKEKWNSSSISLICYFSYTTNPLIKRSASQLLMKLQSGSIKTTKHV